MRKKLVFYFSRGQKTSTTKQITQHYGNLFHFLISLAPWVPNIISIRSPECVERRKDSEDPGTFWIVYFSGLLLKMWIVFCQSIPHTLQALTNSLPCLVGKYSSCCRERRKSSSFYWSRWMLSHLALDPKHKLYNYVM